VSRISPIAYVNKIVALLLGFAAAAMLGNAAFAQTAKTPEAQAQYALLLSLAQESAPGSSEEDNRKVVQEFTDYLRRTSPIMLEKLSNGVLDSDELRSRFRIFVENRKTASTRAVRGKAEDPMVRVVASIAKFPDVAQTPPEAKKVAERFIQRLKDRSRMAHEALLEGTIPAEELETRLAAFVAELRSEAAASLVDPAKASLPTIIDRFVKANLGQAPERANAIAFSGTIQQAGKPVRSFVIFKKRPNRMRMHILENDVVVGMLGFDGKNAWSQSAGEPAIRTIGSAETDLESMARFDPPLVGYAERSAEVERLPDDAKGSIRIRIRETDGSETISTITPDTLTEIVTETRRSDGAKEETRLSDYRKVGVLNVPHVQEQWVGGVLRTTTSLQQVNLDSGMLGGFFDRPKNRPIDFMNYMGVVRTVVAREKLADRNEGGTKQ